MNTRFDEAREVGLAKVQARDEVGSTVAQVGDDAIVTFAVTLKGFFKKEEIKKAS